MYELKVKNGKVNMLLKTGGDFVSNTIPVHTAKSIIDSGRLVESDKPGYPICVNDEWYFEGVEKKMPKKNKPSSGEDE